MPHQLRIALKSLALLLSGTGLFLSSWIVIPAPTMFLLTLGVGAPEVCHWLLVLNGVASLVALVGMRRTQLRRLALGASLLGLFLSALPLAQLPGTPHRMRESRGGALGSRT